MPSRGQQFRAWFATPAAAGKTLVWLCWVSVLVAILVGLLYAVVLGVLAVVT